MLNAHLVTRNQFRSLVSHRKVQGPEMRRQSYSDWRDGLRKEVREAMSLAYENYRTKPLQSSSQRLMNKRVSVRCREEEMDAEESN